MLSSRMQAHSRHLPHCDCRSAVPSEHLLGVCCKYRNVYSGRSGSGNAAAAIEPLKL